MTATETQLVKAATDADGEDLAGVYRMYGDVLGQMRGANFLSAKELQEKATKFDLKVLDSTANAEIEADGSVFLRNLARGKYDRMELDKRLALRRSANAAITSNDASEP